MKRIRAVVLLWFAWSMAFAAMGTGKMDDAENVYRTGLTGKRGDFSVSPDGNHLVFTTGSLAHGLRLLDLRNGKIEAVPMESGQQWDWGSPQWSADGKQIVAPAMAVRNNRQVLNEIQVILLDAATWKQRPITAGEGVKIQPFFSADGKTVYYFKGRKRESGATFASRYSLHAINLASGREEQLAAEEFYQVGPGDDRAGVVLFWAIPYSDGKRFGVKEGEAQSVFVLYDAQHRDLRLFPMDLGTELRELRMPRRDKAGNVYFVAAKLPEGGGNYRWFVFRATPEGKAPAILTELPISMRFDIARNTGEIYVMDKQGEEIVFRRLRVRADH